MTTNYRTLNSYVNAQQMTNLLPATITAVKAFLGVSANAIVSVGQTRLMIEDSTLAGGCIILNIGDWGIINEQDLANALNAGHLAGAAIDVFEHEPYTGPLASIERCLLTSHMGSMSIDCRTRMEIEATEEAVRFLTCAPLKGTVPPDEYDVQRLGL